MGTFSLVNGKHNEINFTVNTAENQIKEELSRAITTAQTFSLIVHATINGVAIDITPWTHIVSAQWALWNARQQKRVK
jgi:hypothetical protein